MDIYKFWIDISIQKPPKASNLNGNLQLFNRNLHQKASNLNGNLQNFNGHLKQQQRQAATALEGGFERCSMSCSTLESGILKPLSLAFQLQPPPTCLQETQWWRCWRKVLLRRKKRLQRKVEEELKKAWRGVISRLQKAWRKLEAHP